MYPKKGCLLPGSDADLTIWYPPKAKAPFTITNANLHHNVDYTPYEGTQVTNWPRYTVVRGKVVWDGDQQAIVGSLGDGQFVARGPSQLFSQYEGRADDSRRTARWLHE
jgi:dihydropyrimidinase